MYQRFVPPPKTIPSAPTVGSRDESDTARGNYCGDLQVTSTDYFELLLSSFFFFGAVDPVSAICVKVPVTKMSLTNSK